MADINIEILVISIRIKIIFVGDKTNPMKKVYFLLFALLFMASCKAPVAPEFHDNPVISHRGAWKETGHPQNSLASFKAAAELGCHGSECDVWTINTEESTISQQTILPFFFKSVQSRCRVVISDFTISP